MPLNFFRPPVLVLALAGLIPIVVVGQTTKPTVTAVTSVASYVNGPISPGEMVVIFGSGMGPSMLAGLQLDQQGKVANTLSNVQVLFDGTPTPLIYVSDKQVAAMVPYRLAGKSTTQVQVAYHGVLADPLQKPVASTAPGIFTADASGTGQAAMTNSDGSLNTAANPANSGSYVTFYLTGEGQTDPPGSDGNVAALIANVVLPVTVRIAGHTAQLLYAGSAPGNVNGFAQINAVIPPDLQYGGNLPLTVEIGGVSSQAGVTLAVSGPPVPIPGAPQSLSASVNSSGQVVLTWTPADSFATRFHIERQINGAGFSEIALIQASATTFTDPNTKAGTTYQYRVRAENDYGISAYSAVVSATVPAAQLLPPAPVLQGGATSSSQIHLSWTSTATGVIRFRIERRATTGVYAEISQPSATSTSFDDLGLSASTTFLYRMRAETGAGISPYSNEVTVATLQGLPAAPTNLQATAISASQINLTWANNAPDATAVRVESRSANSSTFTDIGTAATLTSTGVTNLQPNTAYTFRVRAQNGTGFSSYSNEATVTTLGTPVTVVLVHGINQSGGAMEPLARTLRLTLQTRFTVDAGFNWGRCADVPLLGICPTDCTLEIAANELRDYLNRNVPQGDIVLVGYSMGGLIARQLLLTTQFNRTRPIALITLGTPNLGYPYSELLDTLKICTSLGRQMKGDFRANSGRGEFSTYLLNMNDAWANSTSAPAMGRWLAISATSCNRPARFNGSGCPDSNVFSDGVVCDVSARLLFQYRYRPSEDYWSPSFFHSTSLGLMCDNPPSGSIALPALYNAGANSDVGQRLARFINDL